MEGIQNRGAFVTNPTRKEIFQVYELRRELEIMAVLKSVEHLTPSDFVAMEKLVRSEKEVLAKQDFESYVDINAKFHLAITKNCQNIFLNECIETLIQRTSTYLILFDRFLEGATSTPYGYKEHRQIIDLLKEENKEKLELAIQKHFNNSIESLKIQKEYKN